MNFKIASKAVDFFFENSEARTKIINFYGGEPLLAFGLIKEITNYCKFKYQDRNDIIFTRYNQKVCKNFEAVVPSCKIKDKKIKERRNHHEEK